MLYRFIKAALTPVIALNCAAMVVAAGFILFKGLWQPLWLDVMVFFVSPAVFPFLMIPGAMFGGLTKVLTPAKPFLAHVMLAASIGSLIFMLALWAAISFDSVSFLTKGGLVWPALLWGMGGAVAPWAVFAHNDRDNVFFTGLVLQLLLGCVATVWASLSHTLQFWDRFWIVAAAMAALSCAQAVYEMGFLSRKMPG